MPPVRWPKVVRRNEFSRFVSAHPGHTVISYVNTTATTKAVTDVVVTSSNARQIVESFPSDEKIIFGPDRNLGNYINSVTGRDMLLWDGACHVHSQFSLEKNSRFEKTQKRVVHALEICYMTGKTYTSFRTQQKKERPFRIIKIGLTRDREELYERINCRVDQMVEEGLVEEARMVYPHKSLNSLNTVGYKEIFKYLDGEWTLPFAIEKIKQNSRIYSRKQMTWFKRDEEIRWFHPEQEREILEYCHCSIKGV